MFLYFNQDQLRDRDFRGPDFFYVAGVDRTRPRQWWATWQEGGRYPDVIVELLSDTTAEADRTTKKDIYERTFHTREYFLFDPRTNELEGWRLNSRQRYRPIRPNEQGRLWSEELQLWLGPWAGTFQGTQDTWLRFFGPDGGLVPTEKEAEKQRADTEKQRADDAEAEVERLRKELDALRQTPPQP
jgi:Uma2 family endonuclease